MSITLVSKNNLWADALTSTFRLYGIEDVHQRSLFDSDFDESIREGKPEDLLIIDSGIPAIDYWSLTDFLHRHYAGKFIIITDSNTFHMDHGKLEHIGCDAVIDNSSGLDELWKAVALLLNNESYHANSRTNLVDKLNSRQFEMAHHFLTKSDKETAEELNMTRQNINKSKKKIYATLGISITPIDAGYRNFWHFFIKS